MRSAQIQAKKRIEALLIRRASITEISIISKGLTPADPSAFEF